MFSNILNFEKWKVYSVSENYYTNIVVRNKTTEIRSKTLFRKHTQENSYFINFREAGGVLIVTCVCWGGSYRLFFRELLHTPFSSAGWVAFGNPCNHKENMSSVKLPRLRATIYGNWPEFPDDPTLIRELPAMDLTVQSTHCFRQPLMPPFTNCN